MGPEYESSQGKINQEQEQQFQEVASVAFGEVRRGSQINVYCVLEERTRQCFQEGPDFEITVTGIRKGGLRVSVLSRLPYTETFIARMPGGFRTWDPGKPETHLQPHGIIPNEIKVASQEEVDRLYFESPQDPKTKIKLGKFIQTPPVQRILFKK
ncbi:hypothetical protein A3A14_01590 [Candidatus Daviesbacteria bacterium RIFCSPLOWO2_01_FULL_43_38]|uniref:Uncharacterized protein n=1 Tax=Candidatus Daviesbacteria bacterium RIFCSPHIGHO2_12_FULL_43_11 TaxID=1797780 RepID=A0A1F5K1Q4_9BACT|nr:MAG: hypothetical protein A2874_01350 [Candidatus Daviesbacteria bacterium RIFCSPHIGHO2_01_FULL_43_17]OGE34907.1 MAG: hypothetical protein A3E45_04425 [Candidatus Daviesbacteria bacterium RIFCSPHIGHO2_12_FULL_43_11]OGE63885.1 MAG: hypothetical protein A3A14_01590 [Candidatus Daviesbacteria bacterium RIFCSPLOWO2_01_FULL_43_38]OGE70513.1 MAG: hypothetical protein A3J21_00340 [Candidatus Daviesbacteria bacterium RIFCSPLOWO2_02_FULL_43_11]